MHPLRVGLAGIVDYAGLFPPASLALPAVVATVARALRSRQAWMLGRLVVPLAELDACADLAERTFEPSDGVPRWTVSVLAPAGGQLAGVAPAVEAFNGRLAARGIAAVAVETTAAHAEEVRPIADAVPDTLERYIEVPIDATLEPLLDRIAVAGCYAKVRTGGVTADRIPPPADLARFVIACAMRELPFKATAGLHHPLRATHPLTYEPASAQAAMHGFVNLLGAAALLHARLIEPSAVASVLADGDPACFAFEPACLRWKDVSVGTATLADCRAHLLRSIGSCSFDEPVEELRRMGWLP